MNNKSTIVATAVSVALGGLTLGISGCRDPKPPKPPADQQPNTPGPDNRIGTSSTPETAPPPVTGTKNP